MERSNAQVIELIDRILAGETELFSELVVQYQDRLYHSLLSTCGSPCHAEEYAQEAFLRAYTHLDSYKRNASFYSWLYRIAMNVAFSDYRKRKHTTSLCSLEEASGRAAEAGGNCPAGQLECNERIRLIREAIDSLDHDHRAIIVLREIDGLDYRAMSEMLQISLGTVRSRLHRAREELRSRLLQTHLASDDFQFDN